MGSDAPGANERVGLFGGSFDPVHVGHLHAARVAAERFELARVLFVPAARPPHKPGRALAPGDARAALLRLALGGANEPGWSVWEGELAREGPSFTIDTLDELLREGVRVTHLVLGDDNVPGLPSWRRVNELLERVQPVVVPREELSREDLERAAARLPPELAARLRAGWVDAPRVPISATELRALLERGEDPGPLVPPAVREYLLANGIYRTAE
jgi:nicotinate-nucleotide adenylyltransferase